MYLRRYQLVSPDGQVVLSGIATLVNDKPSLQETTDLEKGELKVC